VSAEIARALIERTRRKPIRNMCAVSSSGTSCVSRIEAAPIVRGASREDGTPEQRRWPRVDSSQKETDMDREHVKGVADKAKGAIKDTAGKITGDKKLETEGKTDKAKGDLHKAAGDVKDAFRKATD
jgi:uncharacterized protein YjbJ (UPF0337 family)